MTLDKPFARKDVSLIEKQTAFSGFFKVIKYAIKHPLFRGGESATFERELFSRGQSVGVLLYDPQQDLVGLVKQFRIGCLDNSAGPWVWEVIAGVNDKRESPEVVAVREVREESGLDVSQAKLMPITNYYASPGGSDEQVQLYCALAPLLQTEAVYGLSEENEDILYKTFTYDQAIGAMLDGQINNAATLIALQWLQLNRDKLRGQSE